MDEKKIGKGTEKEKRLRAAFEVLLKSRSQETSFKTTSPEEWLEEHLSKLPLSARADVLEYDKSLAEDGMTDPKKRLKYVEGRITAFSQTYEDRRFTVGDGEHMLKKEFAKERAFDWLNESFGESPDIDDLNKVALLNFDANGLKAVNDLSASHEKGTRYLQRIAEIFHDDKSETVKWLRSQGISEILSVTAGGDEYSVMIKSDAPIEREVIDSAIRMYEDTISKIDASDLVDFSDESVKLRYLGVSDGAFKALSIEERSKLIDGFDSEFPDGFKMRASASGGGATLHDGLLAAIENSIKPLEASDSFSRSVEKIVGGTWDAADKTAIDSKIGYKESLRTEDASAVDKFYSKVLSRTTEARVQEDRLEAISNELLQFKTRELEMASLDELLESGAIDEDTYCKNAKLLRKRYRDRAGRAILK